MPTAATPGRSLAAAFALLLLAGPAGAQGKVTVTGASVGLPTGAADVTVAKFGAWAPVYVQFDVQGGASGDAEVIIEAPDADEVTTTLAVPVNLASDRFAIGHVRPNGATVDVTVTVRAKGGAALSEPFRIRVRPREALQYVVLALGGAPAGFELPRPAGTPAEAGSLRAGRVDLAHIAAVARLPDHWYGYDAADLVVLNTGTAADFVRQLFGADAPPQNVRKREALLEWVRRGGRIATAVGANASLVAALPALEPLLPLALKPDAPARQVEVLGLVWPVGAGGSNTLSGALGGRGTPFAVANLVPRAGRSGRVLSPPPRPTEERPPVVVQGAFGLGRVTAVGFDLDGPQFAEFAARPDFWDFVLRDAGAARASSGGDGKPRPAGSMTEDEDEAAAAVRVHNDTFDGVPVVSFGWVAVLIVLYILLVGPVEYYVLKRLLGRLELTWVTLPVIVLTVSALAYYSASAVKGRDLKVNKVDVVDVDPASNRVYGSTWFTVFSPRIDSYAVAVAPNDGWAAGPAADTAVAAVGAPRAGRAGLSRRRYARTPDGLDGVPVQVWSTKAFAANWSADLNAGSGGRRVESNLVHPPGDRTKVIGTFRHDLPVPDLTDCVAFYAGQAYPLPGEVVARGTTTRLVLLGGESASQWLQTNGRLEPFLSRVQAYAERPNQRAGARPQNQPAAFAGPLPLWGLLFHEGALRSDEGVVARNASVRRLDQSWRLTDANRDEVIVVGRAAPPLGAAEDTLTGPHAASKLWLKGLPGAGDRRPLPGTGRQETWVRIYLPVR